MLKLTRIFLLSLIYILCSFFSVAHASDDSFIKVSHPSEVTVGEPFIVKISSRLTVEDLNLLWADKVIPLAGHGNSAEIMLPAPLEAELQTYSLVIVSANEGFRVYSSSILIKEKDFPVQSLSVDSRYVNPPKDVMPRIERESKKNRAIFAAYTPQKYWRAPLERPLPGIITSEFGVRRVFNDEPRSRHRGVDFRGAEGSEIRSLAAGRVVLAEDQYYAGNFVIVDHGQGVYSSYAHLSAFRVKKGDRVDAGSLIGLVGKTGRVTGPHLHLGFVVQGQSQTPEPLMPDFRVK